MSEVTTKSDNSSGQMWLLWVTPHMYNGVHCTLYRGVYRSPGAYLCVQGVASLLGRPEHGAWLAQLRGHAAHLGPGTCSGDTIMILVCSFVWDDWMVKQQDDTMTGSFADD